MKPFMSQIPNGSDVAARKKITAGMIVYQVELGEHAVNRHQDGCDRQPGRKHNGIEERFSVADLVARQGVSGKKGDEHGQYWTLPPTVCMSSRVAGTSSTS